MPNSVKTYRIMYADTSRTVKAKFIDYTGDGKSILRPAPVAMMGNHF